MSASFWRFGNNYQTIPEITNILQKPDFTLEEVLDDQDIIQELISENGALIEYLGTPEVLKLLVTYIVEDDEFNQSANDDDDKNLSSVKKPTPADAKNENDHDNNNTNDDDRIVNDQKEQFNRDNNEENIITSIDEIENENAIAQNQRKQIDNDDDDDEDDGKNTITSNFDESYNSENEMNFDDEEEEEVEEEEETPEARHHRRAQILAEILSQENWTITHAFMKDHSHLLETLWTILDKPAPLSMSSSTYFMKINEHLLDQHLEDMIKFILNQVSLVERFMRHIDNPPLMDFLLKVISTDKGRELSTGVIDVLQEKKLIPSLISFLGPDHPSTEQSAAADFLKAFITISANSNTDNSTIGPNELTRELVSKPIVEKLVQLMLYGGSGLANSVGIIIEIIRKNNSDYDIVPVLYITTKSHPPLPTDPIYLGTLVKVFAENIPNFTKMLERPTLQVLETPFGSIEPLGFERFKICELVAELLHCSNMALLNDEKGESIVEERDLERIRLKTFAKQQQLQQERDEERGIYGDEDISRDINNLEISEEHKLADDDIEDDDELFHNATDMMITEDDKEPQQQHQQQQQQLDDDADYSVDMDEIDHDGGENSTNRSNEAEEAMIRENPVVGDQLKIALSDNNVIITILDMFFKFPWNNFLHNVVFDIVQQVLNGSMEIGYNKFLAIELFGKGNITKLIIEGQKKCEDYEEQTGLRLGYMGHLTLIAEEVVKFVSLYSPESISLIIHDAVSDEEWSRYVNETLVETREKYNAILGGTIGDEDDLGDDSQGLILDPSTDHDLRGVSYQDDDEDEEEEDDDDYHSLESSQHLDRHDKNQYEDQTEEDANQFSRYMNQQMTNDLPDKFGSSDEDDEDDEPGSWTMSSDFTSKVNTTNHDYRPVGKDIIGNSHNNNNNNNNTNDSNNNAINSHGINGDVEDDDDDYVDPNDDGQSYTRKNHPLYTPTGDLLDQIQHHQQQQQHGSSTLPDEEEYNTDPLSDEDSDDEESNGVHRSSLNGSKSGSDDDDDNEDIDDDDLNAEDLGLMRSTSKGDMGWDDDEQRRLMTVASYIQSHGNDK